MRQPAGLIRLISPPDTGRGLGFIEGALVATGISIFLWSVVWVGLRALV